MSGNTYVLYGDDAKEAVPHLIIHLL